MKHFRILTLLLMAGVLYCAAQDAVKKKEEATAPVVSAEMKFRARSCAYDLEYSVSAAGNFKRRDTYWEGEIGEIDIVLIPLQFFKGNDYVVALGLGTKENSVLMSVFDPAGKRLPIVADEQEGRVLLAIKPEVSGAHYVRLELRKTSSVPTYGVLTYLYR
jgi:hypothetical protein